MNNRKKYQTLLSKAEQENDETAIAIFKEIVSLNDKDFATAMKIFEKSAVTFKESQIKSRKALMRATLIGEGYTDLDIIEAEIELRLGLVIREPFDTL